MRKGRWSNDEGSGEFALPLAPMIDIVFLLVIFFLTSTVLKPEKRSEDRVKIELPAAGESRKALPPGMENLVILVSRNGRVFSSADPNRELDEESLANLLRKAAAGGERNAVVRADRKSPFEASARVIRAAGDAGLNVLVGYKNTVR